MKITTIRPMAPAAASTIQASVGVRKNKNGRMITRVNMSRNVRSSDPVMKSRTL